MTGKKILLIIFLLLIPLIVFSDIKYKVSGRVAYNGVGVSDIEINVKSNDFKIDLETKTDKQGSFSLHLANGEYYFKIINFEDSPLISSEIIRMITVNKKNIVNLEFYLERECKISGKILFNDNTPITGVMIHASNNRSLSMARSDNNGDYLVSGLRASKNSSIMAVIPGSRVEYANNLVLKEGNVLENIDFRVARKISITGIVKNKETGKLIKKLIVIISEGGHNFPAYIDDKGKFSIYNLINDKTYLIVIDAPEFIIQTRTVLFSGVKQHLEFNVEKDKNFFEDVITDKNRMKKK